MCAAHVNNFCSNLVERIDFSDSRVALLCATFFLINNIEVRVRLSGAETITSHDQMAQPSFTSRKIYFVAQRLPN